MNFSYLYNLNSVIKNLEVAKNEDDSEGRRMKETMNYFLQAHKFVVALDRLIYDIKARYIHRPSIFI